MTTPTETPVITVYGKVDSRCYQWLLAKCEELHRSGTDRLVVNLTEMPDIGLSYLYALAQRAQVISKVAISGMMAAPLGVCRREDE